MKKVAQAFYVGLAAYNLYIAVNAFLDNSTNKKPKSVSKKIKDKVKKSLDKISA